MMADIIETHPWEPYVPDDARVLIMGTFPPQPKRWSMDFYYPNRTNDFWYMMGLIFFGDRLALYNADSKVFDVDAIRALLDAKHIALHDTCHRIRRLKDNASDKFLEVVEPVDLDSLLARMPRCKVVATTGEKAAGVVASLTSTAVPAMGECVRSDTGLELWRMPSTSRAFPMRLDKKAEYYRRLFSAAGIC